MSVTYRVTLKSSLVAFKKHMDVGELTLLLDVLEQSDVIIRDESKKLRKLLVDESQHECLLYFLFVIAHVISRKTWQIKLCNN